MAFDPGLVTYPTGQLQHMYEHKADWGFTSNWNKDTGAAFQAAIEGFLLIPSPTNEVREGTYHGGGAWLVIQQAAPNKCAIVRRPSYVIWSGWNLSAAQFLYANNPPYKLGGGALAVFGDVLENIVNAEDPNKLAECRSLFFDTYKSHGQERYDEASESSLMAMFAKLDNYYLPNEEVPPSSDAALVANIGSVRNTASRALAVLEKQS